jgi:predicted phosphodiesterase
VRNDINWDYVKALADKGWSNRRISRHLKTREGLEVDESVIRRTLPKLGYNRFLIPEDDSFEDRFSIVLDQPLVHDGDIAISADWHIPLYDPKYANKFITDARDRGINQLVIAGDFFNFDALSAYDPKQVDAGLEGEIDEAIAVMNVLLETFTRVYFLWGNHDARLHRALGFAMQFRSAMETVFGKLGNELLDRIVFSNLDHMWVESERGKWYICHPKNYTKVPLSTARALAPKVNAHVITAHSHHCAVGYGPDGEKVVAEIGGLFDRHKTGYLQRTTTFPTWQQGYAFLEDGVLKVSSPGWSVN